MPVKIRLARRGRSKRPFYHIVVADGRAPRDGKFIEKIGVYNPLTTPATIELDSDRAYHWLSVGAQPTETARSILRFKGVLYKKHLMRGVNKGAFSEEQAMNMWNEWLAAKEEKVAKRIEAAKVEKSDFWKKVSGVAKASPIAADESASEAFREDLEEAPATDVPEASEEAAPATEEATPETPAETEAAPEE